MSWLQWDALFSLDAEGKSLVLPQFVVLCFVDSHGRSYLNRARGGGGGGERGTGEQSRGGESVIGV